MDKVDVSSVVSAAKYSTQAALPRCTVTLRCCRRKSVARRSSGRLLQRFVDGRPTSHRKSAASTPRAPVVSMAMVRKRCRQLLTVLPDFFCLSLGSESSWTRYSSGQMVDSKSVWASCEVPYKTAAFFPRHESQTVWTLAVISCQRCRLQSRRNIRCCHCSLDDVID